MTYDEFIAEWREGKTHFEVMTSGSTGVPKSIFLSRKFMSDSAMRTNTFFGIDRESRLHSCISPDFIGGKMMAVRSEIAESRLTYEIPSNRPLLGVGKDERISLLAVVPSQMVDLLERIDSLPRLDSVIIGGGAIDDRLKSKILKSGLNAFETYGMTETSSHIALRKVGEEWFHTLPGITVRRDNRECLVVCFEGGEEVVTNDLCLIKDTSCFVVEGRIDSVIVTGGKKVNPFEVERKIADLISSPFVITSEADEKWGRKVVLKIELSSDLPPCEELMSEICQRVTSWERPKEIIMVKRLERTENGKLRR